MFKGVVFNEMKGVYSQPDSMNGTITQQALFPDNSYSVDSGGNPSVIPDLTFEEFRVRAPLARRIPCSIFSEWHGLHHLNVELSCRPAPPSLLDV